MLPGPGGQRQLYGVITSLGPGVVWAEGRRVHGARASAAARVSAARSTRRPSDTRFSKSSTPGGESPLARDDDNTLVTHAVLFDGTKAALVILGTGVALGASAGTSRRDRLHLMRPHHVLRQIITRDIFQYRWVRNLSRV